MHSIGYGEMAYLIYDGSIELKGKSGNFLKKCTKT